MIDDHAEILVLSPHVDDAEIAAGATIRTAVVRGAGVTVAAFSVGSSNSEEWKASLDEIEVWGERRKLFEFPTRRFPEFRQEILDALVELERKVRPSVVIMPASGDTHQDHAQIAAEGRRAFKRSSLLGFEEPWNLVSFEPRVFVPVQKGDVERKVAALLRYKSQIGRRYLDEAYVWGLARTRGAQCGAEYAEAFEAGRILL